MVLSSLRQVSTSRGSVVARELGGLWLPLVVLLAAVLLTHRLAPPELPIPVDRDIATAPVRGELNDPWHGVLLRRGRNAGQEPLDRPHFFRHPAQLPF